MSDHPAPSDHLLGLLSQKAVHHIVRLIGASGGSTPFKELTCHSTRNASCLLRALAAEGFVSRCGSWDADPAPETRFALTERGWELIAQLDRLDEWARARTHNRHRST